MPGSPTRGRYAMPVALFMTGSVLASVILGCSGNPIDEATPIDPSKIPPHQTVEAPPKHFMSIAWLDEDTLVLTSADTSTELVHPEGGIPRAVMIFEPQIESVNPGHEFLSLESLTRATAQGHVCRAVNESVVSRDRPGAIYFRRSCDYSQDPSNSHMKDAVMHLDLDSGQLVVIQQFPELTSLHNFNIEPGGRRIASVVGAGFLSSKLYIFAPDPDSDFDPEAQHARQLLSEYRATDGMHWTSKGLTVIAEGKGQDSDTDLFKILDSKADLILIDPDSGHETVLVKGLENPGSVKWSPDESVLAFGARIKGEDGVWLYHPESKKLNLVWPEVAEFDWSPSGDRLAILHDPGLYGVSREPQKIDIWPDNYPVIISVVK